MGRPAILKPGEAYTFSKYFELPFAPGDILAELGFTLERSPLNLPRYSGELHLAEFCHRLERNLTRVDLTSEAARRETLIAPILLEVCDYANTQLNIEYPVVVSDLLKDTLDYYIAGKQSLLVVEAKQADLTRGFTQLAAELIALDQWTNLSAPVLHGAVTTGDIWKFGLLYREEKRIVQDINLYRVPADLENLMQVLIEILILRG
jgi:hypothetical protein